MSSPLRATEGLAGAGDDAYEALIRGHEGFDDTESAAMNARLVLILANEVGDLAKIEAAIRLARLAIRIPDDAISP